MAVNGTPKRLLPSTKEESNVALRRISTLLRFLRGDNIQPIPKPDSSAAVTVNGTHFDPVLLPCCLADGGIQELLFTNLDELNDPYGLEYPVFRWYWKQLRIDKDGDVADEFFGDISLGEIHLTVSNKDFFPLDDYLADQII